MPTMKVGDKVLTPEGTGFVEFVFNDYVNVALDSIVPKVFHYYLDEVVLLGE